jgi:hypothetical protein
MSGKFKSVEQFEHTGRLEGARRTIHDLGLLCKVSQHRLRHPGLVGIRSSETTIDALVLLLEPGMGLQSLFPAHALSGEIELLVEHL